MFSSFLGGSAYEGETQIALDGSGAILVAGVTNSRDFPVTAAAYDKTHNGDLDIFLVKIDPARSSVVFSTYLGGTGQDHHPMLTMDDEGNVFVTGPTRSPDFPTTENAYDRSYNGTVPGGYYGDVFVAKLDSGGNALMYSSFIGGKGEETVFGIDVAPDGGARITGLSKSADFPCTKSFFRDGAGEPGASNDAYVIGLDCRTPHLAFSVVFGGRGDEQGDEVVCDKAGNLYIVGLTSSRDFPTTRGAYRQEYAGGLRALRRNPGSLNLFVLCQGFFCFSLYSRQGYSMCLVRTPPGFLIQ